VNQSKALLAMRRRFLLAIALDPSLSRHLLGGFGNLSDSRRGSRIPHSVRIVGSRLELSNSGNAAAGQNRPSEVVG
jgi:hypothetical protein